MSSAYPARATFGLFFACLLTLASACAGGSSGGGASPALPWSGTKQFGVVGQETQGSSVATDTSGNVYVTGYTTGGLDGNTPTGTVDCFLAKYDRSGTKLYIKQLGAAGKYALGNSLATDASGHVYVTGYTDGGLDGNTPTGTIECFLTKYDSSGTKLYTKQLGVAGQRTYGNSVATDAGGNVYVTGYTTGGLDGNALMGAEDFFLTKYTGSGTKLYTKQLGAVGQSTEGLSVAADGSGNVCVVGFTYGGLDGNTLAGTVDFFLTKYSSDGTKLYTKQLGVAGGETVGKSVATGASGDVYVAGWTTGGLDGNLPIGSGDFFLTKYNSGGSKLYTKQLGAAGLRTQGNAVATEAGGHVYVTGLTEGGLDGNTPTGQWDLFLTNYDGTGTKLYTKQLGVAGQWTRANWVATDASGNAYVTGATDGDLDSNTPTGVRDCFLTKYSSDGVRQ
jgi:hypothetical protein